MRFGSLVLICVGASIAPVSVAAQQNERDVVLSFMEAWNEHDVERVGSLCHPDAEYTEVATGKVFHGSEGCAQYARETFEGAPDFSLATIRIVRDRNRAVAEWVMKGTQTGDWDGLPATGQQFSVPGVSVIETDGKLIRRVADYWDLNTLLDQLGVLRPLQPKEAPVSSVEENKQLVRHVVSEGVNKGDLEVFKAYLAPDYARHSQATTEMPEIRGIDQMLEFLRVNFTAFPDWHEEIELMIGEGDKVAYITTGTATHTGPLGDIPPTGEKIEVTNYIVHRIEDGKIAETWIGWDNLPVMKQLGLLPDE